MNTISINDENAPVTEAYNLSSHKNVKLDPAPAKEAKKSNKETLLLSPHKPHQRLNKAIQSARVEMKITQKDIAKALAVKLQVYADWENGKAIPSTAAIGKLEQVLGVKLPGPGTPSAVKKLANEKRIAAAGAKKSGVGKSSVGKAVLVERKGVATSMNSKV